MLRLLKLICFEILLSERDFSFYADLNDSVCLDSTFDEGAESLCQTQS